MRLVKATAADGRVFREANGAFHVTGTAAVKNIADQFFNKIGIAGNSGGDKLTQPFRKSVWVRAAIKTVADPIAAVSLYFSEDKRGGDVAIKDPAFNAFWQRPAVNMSQADFVEASASWYQLAGEVFYILDNTWTVNRFGKRNPLIFARPDRMRHIHKGDELTAWEFTDGAGKRHTLLPEEVVHIKSYNPYDSFRGLSAYEAARIAAEADYLAGNFNLNLMKNNGDQGVYVIAKSGIPSDLQQEQIINALREKRRRAANGDFAAAFLTGDITVEDAKVQVPDAAFTAVRLENRHEVAIAFGVPPSMFNIVASYSVGSASDRFRLIEDTCMPLGRKLSEGMEVIAMKWFVGRTAPVYSWFNWREHSVVQSVLRERLKELDGLWSKGMPLKLASEYLDLGLPDFPGNDVGFLPFSVAPVGEQTPPEEREEYAEPAKEEEEEDKVAAMLRVLNGECPAHKSESNAKASERDPKRLAMWREHMAKRRGTQKAFESKLSKVLMGARAEVLRKLNEAPRELALMSKAAAADFMFDPAKFGKALKQEMRKVAATALQTAGDQLFAEIGNDDPFSMPAARAVEFLDTRENRMSDVAGEVFDEVREAIQAGLDDGDSIPQIAQRVRAAFQGIGKGRAMVVAMTETAAAYGVARHEAMEQAGIQYKEWLTSGNANVRTSHMAAEGQTVEINQPFHVGGAELQFPGDPKGPAKEVINCHCVQIAVAKPKENE